MKPTRLLNLAAALAVALGCTQAISQNPGALPLAVAADRLAEQRHTVTGPVKGVSDGDTFYMVIDGQPTRMRLAQIDAPEKAQPFGRRAEQSLRELIGKREVIATWTQADRYGRPIVEVEAAGENVNAEQVRRGFAWVYRRYATDRRLFDLQAEARGSGRGLWADPNAVEPWVWRQVRRKVDR